jgi:hypothetical protein
MKTLTACFIYTIRSPVPWNVKAHIDYVHRVQHWTLTGHRCSFVSPLHFLFTLLCVAGKHQGTTFCHWDNLVLFIILLFLSWFKFSETKDNIAASWLISCNFGVQNFKKWTCMLRQFHFFPSYGPMMFVNICITGMIFETLTVKLFYLIIF